MGYNYTLSFTPFQAVDNEACLIALREASPDIGDYMEISEGHIHFCPDDYYQKWRNAEDTIIPVIMEHIIPGTTCCLYWEGEDNEMGGSLIGHDCCYTIVYEAVVVTDDGTISLQEAKARLTGSQLTYRSSWDVHAHGSHIFYTSEEWRSDVAQGDTILGYQQWVEHNLESLLLEITLDHVDAIEVAGCTEADGVVEVADETDAEFFSVYTHKPGEGVLCHCDFNTKQQASEFAYALAARTSIPVYGNLCHIEKKGLLL